MARKRLALIAALAALALSVLAGASTASAASTTRHHHHRHLAHCLRSKHARGKAGSFRTGRHLHRRHHHRRRCGARRHSRHRHHRASKRHARRHVSAAAGGSCTDTQLVPSPTNLDRVRAATLCLVNRERVSHGERPLKANDKLEQAAQGHSESMAAQGYFEHVGPGGDTPLSRMRASGYVYSSQVGYEVGENIAWATGSLSTPRAVVSAWMGSPGHRANILDASFRDSAVGVSADLPASMGGGADGGIYTQDFGVIISG